MVTKIKNPDRLKSALIDSLEIAKTLNIDGYTLQDKRYVELAELINKAVTTFLIAEVSR